MVQLNQKTVCWGQQKATNSRRSRNTSLAPWSSSRQSDTARAPTLYELVLESLELALEQWHPKDLGLAATPSFPRAEDYLQCLVDLYEVHSALEDATACASKLPQQPFAKTPEEAADVCGVGGELHSVEEPLQQPGSDGAGVEKGQHQGIQEETQHGLEEERTNRLYRQYLTPSLPSEQQYGQQQHQQQQQQQQQLRFTNCPLQSPDKDTSPYGYSPAHETSFPFNPVPIPELEKVVSLLKALNMIHLETSLALSASIKMDIEAIANACQNDFPLVYKPRPLAAEMSYAVEQAAADAIQHQSVDARVGAMTDLVGWYIAAMVGFYVLLWNTGRSAAESLQLEKIQGTNCYHCTYDALPVQPQQQLVRLVEGMGAGMDAGQRADTVESTSKRFVTVLELLGVHAVSMQMYTQENS